MYTVLYKDSLWHSQVTGPILYPGKTTPDYKREKPCRGGSFSLSAILDSLYSRIDGLTKGKILAGINGLTQ